MGARTDCSQAKSRLRLLPLEAEVIVETWLAQKRTIHYIRHLFFESSGSLAGRHHRDGGSMTELCLSSENEVDMATDQLPAYMRCYWNRQTTQIRDGRFSSCQ